MRQWLWRVPGSGWNLADHEEHVPSFCKVDGEMKQTEVVEVTHLNSTPSPAGYITPYMANRLRQEPQLAVVTIAGEVGPDAVPLYLDPPVTISAPSALNRLGYLDEKVVEMIQGEGDGITRATIWAEHRPERIALYIEATDPADADLVAAASHLGSDTPSAIDALNSTLQDDLANALAVYAESHVSTGYDQMKWAQTALYFELTNDQYVTGERRLLKKHLEEMP